jgi:mannose-6-phosphate isomerase-like protein (cupin superfamily)
MNISDGGFATRREFLRTAPAAAVVGLASADLPLSAATAAAGQSASGNGSFQIFRAQQLADDAKALDGAPGNNNLVQERTFTVVLTVEKQKSAAEFEWHEGRDHVFLILEGETIYQVGGTPKGAHSIGPGEWHAPESEGATTLTLNKGDMLVVPRSIPHKRSTAGSVTFYLISPQGSNSQFTTTRN